MLKILVPVGWGQWVRTLKFMNVCPLHLPKLEEKTEVIHQKKNISFWQNKILVYHIIILERIIGILIVSKSISDH